MSNLTIWFITAFDARHERNARIMNGTIVDKTPEGRPNYDRKASKCVFGWYETKEEAEDAVRDNYGDLHECLYTKIVIEGRSPGIYSNLHGEQECYWYDWNPIGEDPHEGHWRPCEAPDWTRRQLGFAY